jgi:hypothetical protein
MGQYWENRAATAAGEEVLTTALANQANPKELTTRSVETGLPAFTHHRISYLGVLADDLQCRLFISFIDVNGFHHGPGKLRDQRSL